MHPAWKQSYSLWQGAGMPEELSVQQWMVMPVQRVEGVSWMLKLPSPPIHSQQADPDSCTGPSVYRSQQQYYVRTQCVLADYVRKRQGPIENYEQKWNLLLLMIRLVESWQRLSAKARPTLHTPCDTQH
jgi:hypothetical protein